MAGFVPAIPILKGRTGPDPRPVAPGRASSKRPYARLNPHRQAGPQKMTKFALWDAEYAFMSVVIDDRARPPLSHYPRPGGCLLRREALRGMRGRGRGRRAASLRKRR